MTEIRYVCKDSSEKNDSVTIEINGTTSDLFKGLCRIAASMKKKLKLKDGVKFEDVLLEGIEVAESENKLSDIMNNKDADKKVDELLDLLNKLLGSKKDD